MLFHVSGYILAITNLISLSDVSISEKDKRDGNVNIVQSNTRIIDAHKNWKVLLIKEALKIKELKPILNNGLKASKEQELFIIYRNLTSCNPQKM